MLRYCYQTLIWLTAGIYGAGYILFTWPVYIARNFTNLLSQLFFFIMALFLCFFDQIMKINVINNLEIGETINVIENFFSLTRVHNYGAAFGVFQHQLPVFIMVAVFAIAIIVIYSFIVPRNDRWMQLGLALLLAGATGNFIDRISYGYVVDFLHFHWYGKNFPIFNIADVVIDAGVIILLYKFWTNNNDYETGILIENRKVSLEN